MNSFSNQDPLNKEPEEGLLDWEFLVPDQRRIIDWDRYAALEVYHSRNYDPHQGVSVANKWKEYLDIPSIMKSYVYAEPFIGGGDESIFDMERGGLTFAGPLLMEYGVQTPVLRTSVLNPIPIQALESFHFHDLGNWNTNVVEYLTMSDSRPALFKDLRSHVEEWRDTERTLNESADRFTRLIGKIEEIDKVMKSLHRTSRNTTDLFSRLSQPDAHQCPSIDIPRERDFAYNQSVESSIHLTAIKSETQEEVMATVKEIRSARAKLNLKDIFQDYPDIFQDFSDVFNGFQGKLVSRVPRPCYFISSALKSYGREHSLANEVYVPMLEALDRDIHFKLDMIYSDEIELGKRQYLFHMAVDLSIPENGAKVEYAKSIRTPIGLRLLNSRSVCRLKKLEVDFQRMGWSGESWRTFPEIFSMPEDLQYQMYNTEKYGLDTLAKEITPEKYVNIGNQIVARNARTFRELSWRGPICQRCYLDDKHDGDHVGAHTGDHVDIHLLDIDKAFQIFFVEEGASVEPKLWKSTPQRPLPTKNFTNLVVLDLSSWRFTKDCLINILKFSPHLISLGLQKCLLVDNQEPTGTVDFTPALNAANDLKGGMHNISAFQHRGLRVLSASISTLFSPRRHEAFYKIFDDSEENLDDREMDMIDIEVLLPIRKMMWDDYLYRKSLTPELYDKYGHPGPNMTTLYQVDLIERLEPSIFHLFPNLEHWKLTPGIDNSRQVPWIGMEVQKYCRNLNKLTLAENALPDSDTAALLVRAFRPIPSEQLESCSSNYGTLSDEENDPDNILVRRGYRLANGKGLKLFCAEEKMYSTSLIRSLMLHSSTLEKLDLDANNEHWNMTQGEGYGLPYPSQVGDNNSNDGSDIEMDDGDEVVSISSTEFLKPKFRMTVDDQGYDADNEVDMKSGGASSTAQSHSAGTGSTFVNSPASSSQTKEYHQEDRADEGPRRLRRPFSELNTLLQQLTCIQHLKLPRNTIDTKELFANPPWEGTSSLEELWISFKDLSDPTDISKIMEHIGATPVRQIKATATAAYTFDNFEGIKPLPYSEVCSQDNGNEFLQYELVSVYNYIDSASQLHEYINSVLYPEDEEIRLTSVSNNDELPLQSSLNPIELGVLQYQVKYLLRQFHHLRYVWIGDGLYQLSSKPEFQKPKKKVSSSNGNNVSSENEVVNVTTISPMRIEYIMN